MKRIRGLGLLAGLLAAAVPTGAWAMDESACRAGYSTMLLTRGECQNWLKSRAELQGRGDTQALRQLDDGMQALLAERAESCPCTWERKLRQQDLEKSAQY